MATPLAIPSIYGADAVHGHNNVYGATVFPHNIGLGAAHDPRGSSRWARYTADEIAATGVDWGFAPCLCVARDDRWGRTYESFGEVAAQRRRELRWSSRPAGRSLDARTSIMATAKHYIGDGGTAGGVDQGNTQISLEELRQDPPAAFRAAIERGVGSVMVSFSSWNGVKDSGNKYLITDLLKGELHFPGFVVSDWNAIEQIDGQPGFTPAEVTASVNAGIDMFMVPYDSQKFIDTLRAEVQNGHVPMARINDANRRILTVKFKLGLFEHPYADRGLRQDFGSAQHRALARRRCRVAGGAEERPRRAAAGQEEQQDLRRRQERRRHRQPGGRLDVVVAGPERRRHPRHHDPRRHLGRTRVTAPRSPMTARATASTPATRSRSRWSVKPRTPKATATGRTASGSTPRTSRRSRS